MTEGYWRTTQAAGELGISPRHMRKLCEAGMVEAERTDGGQWRIPMQEIERLKKSGVPPVPLTAEPEIKSKPSQQNGSAALLAPPSSAVIDAAEEALISENELRTRRNKVEKLKLKQEATQIGDFFRNQRQQEDDNLAARRRQEQEEKDERDREQQQEQAAQARREWRDEWIRYAQRERPYDAPKTVELDIVSHVERALEKLDPSRDYYVVCGLVDAAIESALVPWKKGKERQEAVDSAVGRLDFEMKYDREWKGRTHAAAAEAIERLPAGASRTEMETAGTAALQPLILEYEHSKQCRELASNVWMKLRNETPEERQEAQDTVRAACDELPISASRANSNRPATLLS